MSASEPKKATGFRADVCHSPHSLETLRQCIDLCLKSGLALDSRRERASKMEDRCVQIGLSPDGSVEILCPRLKLLHKILAHDRVRNSEIVVDGEAAAFNGERIGGHALSYWKSTRLAIR